MSRGESLDAQDLIFLSFPTDRSRNRKLYACLDTDRDIANASWVQNAAVDALLNYCSRNEYTGTASIYSFKQKFQKRRIVHCDSEARATYK